MELSKSNFKIEEKNLPILLSEINTFFGYTYSDDEKKKWWELKHKKFKIGLIRGNDLDTQVSIFGELYDFSKKSYKQREPPMTYDEKEEITKKFFLSVSIFLEKKRKIF